MASCKRSFPFAGKVLLLLWMAWPSLPMAAETSLRQTFLTVRINSEVVAENAFLLESEKGRYAARVADFRDWRLNPPTEATFFSQGEGFAFLDAISGLTYRLDSASLTLDISAPPELFDRTILFQPRRRLLPQAGAGAYLNYDVVLDIGEERDTHLGGVAEFVAFRAPELGVLENRVLVQDGTGEIRLARLESTWTKDLIDKRQSIRVGDAFTAASALAVPVRFGGVQWATNFATDPTFITTPKESVAGLADRPSVVDVFVNDVLRATTDVPRGPFEIDRIPGLSGQGEVRLVVTDVLGREQVIVQPYDFSPNNLAAGLSDFSVEAGVVRENFSAASFDYGSAFLSGSYRFGFTDRFTGEGHLEAQERLRVGGLSGDLVVPSLGRFSAFLLGSHGSEGTGSRQGLTYEYIRPRFNLGLSTAFTSKDFRQLGFNPDGPATARTDQIRLGLGLGDLGSLGLSYVHQDRQVDDDRSILTGSYRVSLGFGTLLIDGSKAFEPDEGFAVSARLVIPFAGNKTLIAGVNRRQKDQHGANLEFQQGLGSSDLGISYRLRGETDAGRQRLDGAFSWQTRSNRFSLDATRIEGSDNGRLGVSGGLGVMSGLPFLSRRIDRSFAVVDAGGIEGVTVYLENREIGKTDKAGRIYVPALGAYRANQISLEPSDIPLHAAVSNLETVAVPYFRSGAAVNFPVRVTRSATVTLVDGAGVALPSGSIVRGEDGVSNGRVAKQGLTYLTDLGVGRIGFTVQTRRRECGFVLELPEEIDLLPDLGEVACR